MRTLQQNASLRYNLLLDIAEAKEELASLGGERTIGQLLDVIRDAGLEELTGIRLLHKHNDVLNEEIMLETSVRDEEGFALVTSPVRAEWASDYVPNSWQLTSAGFEASEYSRPQLLVPYSLANGEWVKMFGRLSDALKDCHVENVLGPCLHYGPEVEGIRPHADDVLLEKTDDTSRANVMRFVSSDDRDLLTSTKTKWQARQVMGPDGKLIWATACKCSCSTIPETGKHQGTHFHSS